MAVLEVMCAEQTLNTMEINTLVHTLKEQEEIVLVKDTSIKLETLEEGFLDQYPYLKDFKDDILFLNENHVLWNYKNDEGQEIPGGEFHLRSIYDVVKGDIPLEYSNVKLPNFMVFEDHPQAGDGLLVGITFNENQQLELWLYQNSVVYPLDLDLKQYFEELVRHRGLYNWQYLFVDHGLLEKHNAFMLNQLPVLRNLHEQLFKEKV